MLSPGIELHFNNLMVYGDVEMPVFQHMHGNQLVAFPLFKTTVSYQF